MQVAVAWHARYTLQPGLPQRFLLMASAGMVKPSVSLAVGCRLMAVWRAALSRTSMLSAGIVSVILVGRFSRCTSLAAAEGKVADLVVQPDTPDWG